MMKWPVVPVSAMTGDRFVDGEGARGNGDKAVGVFILSGVPIVVPPG